VVALLVDVLVEHGEIASLGQTRLHMAQPTQAKAASVRWSMPW
jgi:hypothetical protein